MGKTFDKFLKRILFQISVGQPATAAEHNISLSKMGLVLRKVNILSAALSSFVDDFYVDTSGQCRK